MDYVQDVPRADPEAIELIKAHVVAYLSAVASEDDDPETNADDVRVWVMDHPDDPALVRVKGTLDAEPDAPYLRPDFDPLAGVDPGLYASEVEAAVRDEEVLRGQA
jgi:hypothetical protein